MFFLSTSSDANAPLPTSVLCCGEGEGSQIDLYRIDQAVFQPSVERLILRNVFFDVETLESTARLITSDVQRQWKLISLRRCSGQVSEFVKTIFESNVHVEEFTITNCFHGRCDIPTSVAKGLQEATTPANNTTTTKGLMSLNLSSNSLSASDVIQLCEALQETSIGLKTLCLSNCALSDDQIAMLVRSLPASIVELDLSSNHCRRHGLEALGRFLTTSQLKKLFLVNQNLSTDERLDLTLLVEGIKKSKCLDQLILTMNRLGGLDALAQALTVPTSSLRYLRLNDCNLNPKDIEWFFKYFSKFTNLRGLWLSGRQQFSEFPSSVLDCIRSGTGCPCEEIHFHESFDGKEEIQQLLDINRVHRVHLPRMETTTLQMWPMVLERTTVQSTPLPGPLSGMAANELAARRSNIVYELLRNGILLQQNL